MSILPRFITSLLATVLLAHAQDFERLQYNNPGLTVDLAVGLWGCPLPMDFDGDGDLDLVVNCPDTPYNGLYFFENTSGDTAKNKFPVFKAGKRISKGVQYAQVSYVDGQARVLTPAKSYPDFLKTGLESPEKIPLLMNPHPNKIRGNFWTYVDYDGDGMLDIIIGADDWTDYGWDNAYDANGKWTNGPLRGFVYFAKNTGSNEEPKYAKAKLIQADGKPIEVFGWPSPMFRDFDGDGDLDLICGEFLDGFTYFENIGTRTKPKYAPGRRVNMPNGQPVATDLEMIQPVAVDWNKDGQTDIIVGDEDGRIALIENTGKLDATHTPVFLAPHYFQQEAAEVKLGALCTPVGSDWDGDGDIDIISGDSAGHVAFFENLSGPKVEHPKWAAPKFLEADGQVIRIMAGPNGSIQGPAEAKWGYTTVAVADWDGDGLPDLLVNSIFGNVIWYKNLGPREHPKLAAAQPIEVEWEGATPMPAWGWRKPEGKALLTQWRTTPYAIDWNKDGLMDLVMLDQEGYLSLFERAKRDGKLVLLPPKRLFVADAAGGADGDKYGELKSGEPLRMNNQTGGKSGRRKFCVTDWDGDGQLDFLFNATNATVLHGTGQRDGHWYFSDVGVLGKQRLAGHDVSPTTVDFNGDGIPDYLGGAEDGHFYYMRNPRAK